MYTLSARRVDVAALFEDQKLRKRLILSTGDGKYVVKDWIRRWNPIALVLHNHATAIIQTRRAECQGKAYGSNAKYVVEFTRSDGQRETVPIFPRDYAIRTFRNFRLTQEALTTAEDLEEFLVQQAVSGALQCRDLKVHDLESFRNDAFDERKKPPIVLEQLSWFRYYILGRVGTLLSDRKLRRENRARRKEALSEAHRRQVPGRLGEG